MAAARARTGGGQVPVSPWGTPAKGYKHTASNKRTQIR